MKTEEYNISFSYQNKAWRLPVRIIHQGADYKISVNIEGKEVCFVRDPHDGLRPLNHHNDFEAQLLYLIGQEVEQQHSATLL